MPPKKALAKPLLATDKIPLPAYLKLLTEGGGMTMPNAMVVAGKM